MPPGHHDRSRADAGRFTTMYDEGACIATPALEHIERANRDASEARLARSAARSGDGPIGRLLAAPGHLARIVSELRRGR